MTRQEAEAKAKELWSEHGHVFDRQEEGKGINWKTAERYWVGDGHASKLGEEWWSGNGNTWEEAFADAKKVRIDV